MTNLFILWKAWRRIRKAERELVINEAQKLIQAEQQDTTQKKFDEFQEQSLNYPIIQDLVNKAASGIKVTITLPNRTTMVIEQDNEAIRKERRRQEMLLQAANAEVDATQQRFI